MIFTESWLRELIDFPGSIEDLAGQLTMAGLEIESLRPCQAGFTGVVVAEILTIEPVPGSDKLTVCTVDAGKAGKHTVLCGASNVRIGRCYPLALPGASLPGGIKIEKIVKQGIRSEGMLCSRSELGLSAEQSEGLYELPDGASPGVAFEVYLGLHDTLVEVSLTPNRGDCLGMYGLAREVAALNNLAFHPSLVTPVAKTHQETRAVLLKAGLACPLYYGRIIHQVNPDSKTPLVIAERLRRCGIRSINVLVDLANYVMLETGQPMHVFDLERLQGTIAVRLATTGERLVLLDGTDRLLTDNTLVIADHSGPVAMAGIMGGQHSAVNPDTRSIFIESAWFDPLAIMGRARHYGLHTDASHRFERGVDPSMASHAIERLSELILSVCDGQAGPVHEVINQAELPAVKTVRLRLSRIHRLLGIRLEAQHVTTILNRLGFHVSQDSGAEPAWTVHVPSYRFDISLEADLIEEVARIHGYHNIEGSSPCARMRVRKPDPFKATLESLTMILSARGYRESINYSFVDSGLQNLLGGQENAAIRLMNPISAEMAVMRQSLWPGLIQALLYNIKRQQPTVRLFETGKIYLRQDNGCAEVRVIAGIIFGNKYNKQWGIDTISCDFYDMKSDLEALLANQHATSALEFTPLMHKALHPGQSAAILLNGVQVGMMGMLHPDVQRDLSIALPAYLFQLDLDKINLKYTIKYNKISKYPSVKRDISIVVNDEINASAILEAIKNTSPQPLINLELFDVYRGEGIDSGKKSLALGLTFQRSSSTLIDEEADVAISDILQSLRTQFGALLRE